MAPNGFATTLRSRPDLAFELVWRPFLLNPDMPRSGMARGDYVVRKFGGEDRAKRLYTSIAEIGRTEGVLFRFERIRRTPNTRDAHRLIRYATLAGRLSPSAWWMKSIDVVPVVFGPGKRYLGWADTQHLLEDAHTVILGDRGAAPAIPSPALEEVAHFGSDVRRHGCTIAAADGVEA